MYVRTYYTRHIYAVSCTYGHTVHVCKRVCIMPPLVPTVPEVSKVILTLRTSVRMCAYIDTRTRTLADLWQLRRLQVINTRVYARMYTRACLTGSFRRSRILTLKDIHWLLTSLQYRVRAFLGAFGDVLLVLLAFELFPLRSLLLHFMAQMRHFISLTVRFSLSLR